MEINMRVTDTPSRSKGQLWAAVREVGATSLTFASQSQAGNVATVDEAFTLRLGGKYKRAAKGVVSVEDSRDLIATGNMDDKVTVEFCSPQSLVVVISGAREA